VLVTNLHISVVCTGAPGENPEVSKRLQIWYVVLLASSSGTFNMEVNVCREALPGLKSVKIPAASQIEFVCSGMVAALPWTNRRSRKAGFVPGCGVEDRLW
jgi:hypothetical protein